MLVEACFENYIEMSFLDFASRCVVSGSGKIAMHVLEKLIAYGALPISVSGNCSFL